MAFTYSWQSALDFLKAFARNIPVTQAAQICDAVSSEMWSAFPWKDTCQTIPPTLLVDDQQDYSSPPTFFRLVSGQIVRTAPAPDDPFSPLEVRENLPFTAVKVHPSYIHTFSLERGEGLLRLEWRPAVQGSEVFELRGTYQMQHTRVEDLSQETWFKDQLWHVAQEGLLYWGYKLGDKPLAAIEAQYKLFRGKLRQAFEEEDAFSSDTIYPVDGSIGGYGVGPG